MNRRDWNPLYLLRWDDHAGEHTLTGTSRDIHLEAPALHIRGESEEVWDIAVLDDEGTDVTGRFFDHLDNPAA
ncbi:hypothetical protein [Streptomyces tricolor]